MTTNPGFRARGDSAAPPSSSDAIDALMRVVVEGAGVGLAVVDSRGLTVRVNASLCQLLGYSAEELSRMTAAEVTHPDDVEKDAALFRELVAGGGRDRYTIDKRYLHKSGATVWGRLTLTVVNAGSERYAVAVVEDITDRRAAEEAIRAAHERYELVARATNDVIWDWDPVGGTIVWNDALRTMFGYEPAGIPDPLLWWERHIHPEDRDRVVSGINAVINGTGTAWTDEYRFERADGRFTEVLDRAYVSRGTDGRPVRMIGAMVDITERKEAERAAESLATAATRLYAEAEAANRTKDEFLATLSHELRTPLTAILGWAQMLVENDLDDDLKRSAVETIHRSAIAQARLIDDVLDVSRITTGKLRLDVRPVSMSDVIRGSLDAVALAASARGVEIAIEDRDPAVVMGDPTRLQQIVWNLLTNAIKFTRPGGRVSIETRTRTDLVTLTVSDDGQGIPPDLLPHIFEPFRQGDPGATRPHSGLGLGLAIVRYLVEAHGGTVTAHSEGPGKGARFQVELPRHTASDEQLSFPNVE